VSKTLEGADLSNIVIINEDIPAEIKRLKQETGKDILVLGSPSVVHLLMNDNLIDEYWLFLNPVLLA
jgi:dihydrofolate reductase